MTTKPGVRPARPFFSSGPTAKHAGWNPENFGAETRGRSHRSAVCKARLKEAIDRTRALLEVPDEFRIAIVPASDTGAVEMAMWTMLGLRPVTVAAWESFGSDWVEDIGKQLKIEARMLTAPFGELPDLASFDPSHDLVFTWNGTTAGVRVPNADWIPADREGLAICDATSAAFAQPLDWSKLDVVTYSFQKVMGGEAGHGVLIISPRAVERLETYTPPWPLPKIFRLTNKGKLNEGVFAGVTINTPSMLVIEDYIDALKWGVSLGGLSALMARADANLAVLTEWAAKTDWVDFLCQDETIRSNTGVCFKIVDPAVAALDVDGQRAFVKKMEALLAEENAGVDLGAYPAAPPGLRIWCGATVERSDIEALCPWLNWAFAEAKASLS
ncbi:MAG: phosphoserine transaminase [Parvularculaceae bacterium]